MDNLTDEQKKKLLELHIGNCYIHNLDTGKDLWVLTGGRFQVNQEHGPDYKVLYDGDDISKAIKEFKK